MRTEEYDFLVELFDEEQQNKAKSLDPNRLDLGYWRASKILDSSIVGAKENVSIDDLNIFPNEGKKDIRKTLERTSFQIWQFTLRHFSGAKKFS
jgi:hypothetical protein